MQIPTSLATDFLTVAGRLRTARRHVLKDKALIYGAFDPEKVYIVEHGYVRLGTTQADGRLATRALLGKASIFGDLPFCPSTSEQSGVAVASGETYVLELKRPVLEAAVHQDETVRQILLEIYGLQFRFLDRRLQWQFVMPLERRIATVLLDLMCFGGKPCPHHPGYAIDIRLTHQELSELVLAARSNVTPILHTFRAHNVISYSRAYICVRTLDALAKIGGDVAGRQDASLRSSPTHYPPMYTRTK
jgi:CRP/FNR family cyclic AMP-dependent transcriptional regulator